MSTSDLSTDSFSDRHLGPRPEDVTAMLEAMGLESLDQLISEAVPKAVRTDRPLDLAPPLTEHEVLYEARSLARRNSVVRSYIGMGYYASRTPLVILRNILENPGWYTQYTPYQAEISQGRLEALLNFQTMVSDLTGLELANSSLLDEGTAAAEAMGLCYSSQGGKEKNRFFVADHCHPQTVDVIRTRAAALPIQVVLGDLDSFEPDERYFGALFQYPASDGRLPRLEALASELHDLGALVVVATDLLSLTLLRPPGEWGADVAVGNSQRFGVPLGFGGPHAGFFSTRESFKRLIPGRIVGVSRDRHGDQALRLAMQTREQHIRREKATSNICTAQVLLAIMASMYAVYHGPERLRRIARRIHRLTASLAASLEAAGYALAHSEFFDTIRILVDDAGEIQARSLEREANLRYFDDGSIGISLDETTTEKELEELAEIFNIELQSSGTEADRIPSDLERSSPFLTHPVFHSYHSETEMLRYITRLQQRDLSLTAAMIPLGSCTMKLNATAEMIPVTWAEWSDLHPLAPQEQAAGYLELFQQLESMLVEITGLDAVSLQPNSGAQGEYAGLLTIRDFHRGRGENHRRVCLIPQSAHGTNPASAVMAGMEVVTVKCRENGDIDVGHLKELAERHEDTLAALMVTYPSTHGVFEESIQEICDTIHRRGGQVYMDGANMNALVGLCRPGEFGVDVCHLNLHKTFCIPHGGGGPGVGPIAVAAHLSPYLPGHFALGGEQGGGGPVAAAPWGSAGILPISWSYIRMMGSAGLTRATEIAILNANYIAHRLNDHFPVLYRGAEGRVAHECILDCRRIKKSCGVTVADIAKRLMDYGFHAPTISWPVLETMMVEPTESESREELDRFCEAMIAIRREIDAVERGEMDPKDNPLKNAPHTAHEISRDDWTHPYSREVAAYPLPWVRERKFWTFCGRVDDTYGDRNLFCSCPPLEEYA